MQLGTVRRPFTADNARDLAALLRDVAPRLLDPLAGELRAELELILQDNVLGLLSFGQSAEHKKGLPQASAMEKANQLVKTLVMSGLLRSRHNLRRALFLSIDAALPTWSNLCQVVRGFESMGDKC